MKYKFLIVLALLMVSPIWSARKALVIGNSAYLGDSALANPVNDAEDIAEALRQLGYEVQLYKNLGLREMVKAVSQHSASLQSSDVTVFYYSGHGAQAGGENYLIPVDKEIGSEEDLEWDAFPAERVLSSLAKADISIVILDACRDNPFKAVRSANRGLVAMNARAGSQYIIFSTEQGKTASDGYGERNSPFTSAFIHHITTSNKKIEDLMKDVSNDVRQSTNYSQTPWLSGSLIKDFYFKTEGHTVNETTLRKPKVQAQWLYGIVLVSSDRNGILYINEEEITPILQGQLISISDLKIGKHTIRLQSGSKSLTETISLKQGEEQEIDFCFSDLPPDTDSEMKDEITAPDNYQLAQLQLLRSEIKRRNADFLQFLRDNGVFEQPSGVVDIELYINDEGGVDAATVSPTAGELTMDHLSLIHNHVRAWKFEGVTRAVYTYTLRLGR